MYTIHNILESKDVFQGNGSDLIKFVEQIVKENDDENYSILGISDAIEYIEDYCENLVLKLN